MNKKSGLYIILGLIMGAIFGIFFVPVAGNTAIAVVLGSLGGVFIGWFVAAAARESCKK